MRSSSVVIKPMSAFDYQSIHGNNLLNGGISKQRTSSLVNPMWSFAPVYFQAVEDRMVLRLNDYATGASF